MCRDLQEQKLGADTFVLLRTQKIVRTRAFGGYIYAYKRTILSPKLGVSCAVDGYLISISREWTKETTVSMAFDQSCRGIQFLQNQTTSTLEILNRPAQLRRWDLHLSVFKLLAISAGGTQPSTFKCTTRGFSQGLTLHGLSLTA